MKPKFTYQSYDYAFLYKDKKCGFWTTATGNAIRAVASNTIGFDTTVVQPMNAPIGILYYYDFANLNDRITEASNEISRRSSKGRANYAVVGSRTYNAISDRRREESIAYFKKRSLFKKLYKK